MESLFSLNSIVLIAYIQMQLEEFATLPVARTFYCSSISQSMNMSLP